VRQIEIEADPPQPVQIDGEMADNTLVSAGIMPGDHLPIYSSVVKVS
jgi:diacylglycerol kinase family enzyme